MCEKRIAKAFQSNLDQLHLSAWRRDAIRGAAGGGEPVKRARAVRTAAMAMALVAVLCGAAYALKEGMTAGIFGWLYGENRQQELQAGDQAVLGLSRQLGDVIYTLEDVVYKKDGEYQGLYGTIRIRPAQGSNVVLIPNDFSVHEPAGYPLHLEAGETVPDGAPSYAQLAKERNARILTAKASVQSVAIDGEACPGSFGELWIPQPDGSIVGTMEIIDNMRRAEQYELTLCLSNWEVTLEDEHLRKEPQNTWIQEEWRVTVQPAIKEEAQ